MYLCVHCCEYCCVYIVLCTLLCVQCSEYIAVVAPLCIHCVYSSTGSTLSLLDRLMKADSHLASIANNRLAELMKFKSWVHVNWLYVNRAALY